MYPGGKKFGFTIIDDTDNSTVFNTKPVYDCLRKYGLRTTKTVWVYPPRDRFSGQSLQDEAYLTFVRELIDDEFEIALHNVGSGDFKRDEIRGGIEEFKNLLGLYPAMQINHSRNKDNMYWGYKRFVPPLAWIFRILQRGAARYEGEIESSEFFWGDICKEKIKYIRNHTSLNNNTYSCDPNMPYRVKKKDAYSNYWFSATDAHTVEEFLDVMHPRNVDRLESARGICILYTHFGSGFTDENGKLDSRVQERIQYIAHKKGWFVPAGTVLDFLIKNKNFDQFVSTANLIKLDFIWLYQRMIKLMRYTR